MLNIFVPGPNGLVRHEPAPGAALPAAAVWLDLREPTAAEEQQVEQALGIDVPTREEMREIEASNRLYEENGSLYLTATVVTRLDTDLAESTQVTFILAGACLVTNRYADPLPFQRFIALRAEPPGRLQLRAAAARGPARGVRQPHRRRAREGRRRHRSHLAAGAHASAPAPAARRAISMPSSSRSGAAASWCRRRARAW